jgi:hypothetical protein
MRTTSYRSRKAGGPPSRMACFCAWSVTSGSTPRWRGGTGRSEVCSSVHTRCDAGDNMILAASRPAHDGRSARPAVLPGSLQAGQ